MAAGSKVRACLRSLSRPLAVCAVPLVLAACVATPQPDAAGFAASSGPAEAAVQAAAVESAGAGTGASAASALAPIRRENGTISGSTAIDQMIAQAADANNIPRDLAFGVVHVESTYNPRARGRGVYGLSQIMPTTARSMGFSGPTDALFDPATNLRYGMRYLAGAWEKGGRDVCRASMKYKGGHRATTMTRSAAAYCGRVRQHMARIAGNPILSGAPVQLAANAPATAAIEVASAAPAPAPVVVPAPAAGAASAPVQEAATAALVPASAPANPASAAIDVAARPEPRPAEKTPSAEAPAAVVDASLAPEEADEPAPVRAEAPTQAAEADFGAPDPARFGG